MTVPPISPTARPAASSVLRRATRRRHAALVIAALLAAPAAHASGDTVVDEFVTRSRTEVPFDRYGRGELGIVLPSYSRATLYPAWRAIASADAGRPLVPVSAEAIDGACCNKGPDNNDDWQSEKRPAIAAWLALRAELAPVPPRWKPVRMKRVPGQSWQEFLNCTDGAYTFATETLADLRRRDDATPARLADWIEAQDRVFGACGGPAPSRYAPPPASAPPLPPPPAIEPLPDSEPPHWRQARGYQRAAAAFYAGDWLAADSLFGAIAHRDSHAWQGWAALAQMRTKLRRAELGPRAGLSRTDADLVKTLEPLAAAIAAHPDWTVQHRSAQALMDIARSRYQPGLQIERLSRTLADLDHAPDARVLVDWSRLSDDVDAGDIDRGSRGKVARPGPSQLAALPVLAWTDTLRACARADFLPRPGASVTPDADPVPTRSRGFAVALARWRAHPDQALWLVPTLACADSAALSMDSALRQALMQAVDRVPAEHPAWMTLRWNAVRLLREAGQRAAARDRLAPLVAGNVARAPSPSARNLIAQEALALARTADEALPWLQREHGNWARYTFAQAPEPSFTLSADSARLILDRFTLRDWHRAVASPLLAKELRTQLAYGLWWRAELLGRPQAAREAAEALGALLPQGAALVEPYLKATTPAARRSALWRLSMQRGGLTAQVGSALGNTSGDWLARGAVPAEARASQWCRLDDTDRPSPLSDEMVDLERAPPVSPDFPEPATLAADRAALKAVGSATGSFARWVLAESRRADRPADLDWLLYVGVRSTRGGCVDADNTDASRAMHQALHRLYPKSPWAAKAPYWY